ncbi:unnamed protein product, partial [Ilex paraguariensis]
RNRPVRNFLDFLTPATILEPTPIIDPTSPPSAASTRLTKTEPKLIIIPNDEVEAPTHNTIGPHFSIKKSLSLFILLPTFFST